MRMTTLLRGLGLAAILAVAGCKSLDITNPNDADGDRALSDPDALESFVGGSVQTWFNAYIGLGGGGPLVTQARTYSSAWNNFHMLFYSSVDGDGTRNTRSWQNDPNSPRREAIEYYWENYYRSLGLANLVLKAIRVNGMELESEAETRRAETVAEMMRGISLSGIALNYDKGYILNETTDLAAISYANRRDVRDSAVAAFDRAIALATANEFTTPSGWSNGRTYTNDDIAKIANTMAAFTLANYPRDSVEALAVDWPEVVSYASNGLSSGTPLDYVIEADGDAWWSEMNYWFAIDGGRVHTRVAQMLDPSTQTHPYPDGGNPQPNSPDRRMGDGSFGTAATAESFGTVPATANAGTDFAWTSVELFDPARGTYHQSNIAHIRFDETGVQSPSGAYGGRGPTYLFTAGQNDLLWAEGLLRQAAPNLSLAADKINNTRVGRGGLPPALASETREQLLAKWSYEMEIEVLGLGAASYYHRRRAAGGLIPGTPREMPVPAKELLLKGEALYSFGGNQWPAKSDPP